MLGYLTPDSLPADTICRTLFIPNNAEFLANVTGALQVLLDPAAWTQFGALTPEQSAAALVNMFDMFCFNQGVCRVIAEIICLATNVSPDPKWLLCDGSCVLISDYPDLFAVIGTTYGTTPDGLHFCLPDLVGRVIVGTGTGWPMGDKAGEETHVLTVAEMPSHTHTDAGHSHTYSGTLLTSTVVPPPLDGTSPNPIPVATGSGFANIQNTGGDGAHNNMQPYTVLSYFIVALP